jgi:hypothetical protein
VAGLHELHIPEDGKLSHNILHFARALRKAGLKAGPARAVDAIRAVEVAGFTQKRDFHAVLAACFVSRPEERVVFDQVFRLYWRDPRYHEQMMSLMLPSVRGTQEERRARAAEKRAAEALLDGAPPQMPEPRETPGDEVKLDLDASQTASAEERLRQLDFEQMSTAETAEARRMLARLTLPVPPILTRRTRAAALGRRPDWRATAARSLRRGGEIAEFARKDRRARWPALVALCDISGSMSQYSRMVLHFLHAVSNAKGQGWAEVHAFTFGTRLTNITRHMRRRDVDAALAAAGAEAQDWDGGTRIGACLEEFNRDWSRRVLGQGAVVLLITDGLERGAPDALARQMERLHLSCRHLIWLNPLLRYDGFAPKAQGVRAMMAHVDAFRAGHNVASLAGLAAALADPADVGEKARMAALMRAT